jgi:hypothetical protein
MKFRAGYPDGNTSLSLALTGHKSYDLEKKVVIWDHAALISITGRACFIYY